MGTQTLIVVLFIFGIILFLAGFFFWMFFQERSKRREEKQNTQFEILNTRFDDIEKKIGLLTSREKEILIAIGQNLSSNEIGDKLNIAEGTVKKHKKNIYEKLEIHKVTELAPYFNFFIKIK